MHWCVVWCMCTQHVMQCWPAYWYLVLLYEIVKSAVVYHLSAQLLHNRPGNWSYSGRLLSARARDCKGCSVSALQLCIHNKSPCDVKFHLNLHVMPCIWAHLSQLYYDSALIWLLCSLYYDCWIILLKISMLTNIIFIFPTELIFIKFHFLIVATSIISHDRLFVEFHFIFSCARYHLWGAQLVHEIPVPYSPM